MLAKHYHQHDGELSKREKAVAESKQPLPIDPQLKSCASSWRLVNLPVPPDGRLKQLQEDVEASTAQLANTRLAGARMSPGH